MNNKLSFQEENFSKLSAVLAFSLLMVFAASFITVGSVDVRYRDRNPSGWFVLFHAENEDNFKGEVAHLHIYEGELDRARDFIEESLDITLSARNDLGDEISVPVGQVVSWIMEAAGAVARNSDGSFDIFLMTGAKDFFGITTPVVFAGFVPDQSYKPPLPAELVSITGIPAANSIGDHFRDWPRP